jgi:hypothetical protein
LNLVMNEVSFESLRRAINDERIKIGNKKCLPLYLQVVKFWPKSPFWGKILGKIFWGENLEIKVK